MELGKSSEPCVKSKEELEDCRLQIQLKILKLQNLERLNHVKLIMFSI